MSAINPKANFFFDKATQWKSEYAKLREVALASGLTEELKWGVPCYTLQNANVFLIHGFKEYCALLFVKGALLKDPRGMLTQQTENVQSARQMRFAGLAEIEKAEPAIKAFMDEAIELERSGAKVEFKKTAEFNMPEEFINKLDETPGLQDAFEALTPGRQRGYLLHFSSPKQAKTRVARIEKHVPRILDGKGLDD